MVTKAPIRVNFSARELEASTQYLDIEFDSAIRGMALSKKLESKRELKEFAANNKAEPIDAELTTEALAERITAKAATCPSSWLHGSDKAGHRFAKELYCGAEWCKICGKKDSVSHNRRYEAWLPKAQQVKRLGMFVIEFPLASRNKPRSRKALEAYGKLAVKVLSGNYEVAGRRARGDMLRRGEVARIKSRWLPRGMRRWHYFGDVAKELKKLGLKDLFSPEPEPVSALVPTVKSNVHLNCLVDSGYILKPRLLHIVDTLRRAFNEPKLIVHYGYTDKPGAMVHMLKYTTRATFGDIKWDKSLATQLYGFRNMHSWGVWQDTPVWELQEADISEAEAENMLKRRSLGESRCYKDNLPITWSKPIAIKALRDMPDKISLGVGYYELPDIAPPKEHVKEPFDMRIRRLIVANTRQLKAEAQERERLAALPDIELSMLPELVADRYDYGEINSN